MGQILRGKTISPKRLSRGQRKPSRKRVYGEGCFGASLRDLHLAPNKARLVLDQIRGQPVDTARKVIQFSHKRAAYYVDRVLLSALGNADVKSGGKVTAEHLVVLEAYCDEAARLRRFKSGPMGRSRPILRRLCHITVVVGQEQAADEDAASTGTGDGSPPRNPADDAAARAGAGGGE
jgi:large subunit ribosomal protein L22